MPVAPGERPGAAGEDAVPVARLERPPSRRRERPACMVELVVELSLAGDPRDGAVAGVALHGLGRHRAATLELAGGGTRRARRRVEARPDDQLRPWAGPVAFGARPLPAEFHERVDVA